MLKTCNDVLGGGSSSRDDCDLDHLISTISSPYVQGTGVWWCSRGIFWAFSFFNSYICIVWVFEIQRIAVFVSNLDIVQNEGTTFTSSSWLLLVTVSFPPSSQPSVTRRSSQPCLTTLGCTIRTKAYSSSGPNCRNAGEIPKNMLSPLLLVLELLCNYSFFCGSALRRMMMVS